MTAAAVEMLPALEAEARKRMESTQAKAGQKAGSQGPCTNTGALGEAAEQAATLVGVSASSDLRNIPARVQEGAPVSAAAVDAFDTLHAALQLAEDWSTPVFPCDGNKQPRTAHGFKDASRNIEQIASWNWTDALIGVPTGRASGLMVVDIDPAGADWYREFVDRLACGRVHRTRRGHHLLYKMPDVEVRNSTGKIAPGIDVRAEGGYIIWWPSVGLEASGGMEDIGEAPAWLLDQLRADRGVQQERQEHQPHDQNGQIHEGGRNDLLSREAFRLRKLGTTVEQILIILRAINNARCVPALSEEELRQIAEGKKRVSPDTASPEQARAESLTLEEMLSRFVHIARGPMIVDATNTYRRLRPSEFAAVYAHDKIVIEKKAVPVTRLWEQSERRMLAECLTFNPGEGQFFIERGMRHLNIWSPPAWPVVDTTLAAPLLAHLEYLIPDATQRNDLLDWLAHAAQQPEVRPHFHFLLVAAQEGTGRSWLVEVLRRLWGERHAGETDLHRLLDDSFNSLLSGKVLMGVHEVKAPADERYSHRERLKGLLTDSVIRINEKHEAKWTERFCARFLMFSNKDDALPLSETDRRIYAVRCVDDPRDASYYTTLYGFLNDEKFLAAVWHMLRNRDIKGFNPGRRAPLNEMKQQMISAGRTEEQQTAVEFVRACPYEIVGSNDLMEVLAPRDREELQRDHDTRTKAVAAVLKDIGCQTYGRKVKVDHKTMRVWMLRNPARWSAAAVAQISREAESAHLGFAADKFLVDLLMARWDK